MRRDVVISGAGRRLHETPMPRQDVPPDVVRREQGLGLVPPVVVHDDAAHGVETEGYLVVAQKPPAHLVEHRLMTTGNFWPIRGVMLW